MAYEVVELKPWEFAQCTFGEFLSLLRAAREREWRQREDLGWLVHHIYAAAGQVRSVPDLDKLLGLDYTERAQKRRQRAAERARGSR